MKIKDRLYLGSATTLVMALIFFSVVLITAGKVNNATLKEDLLRKAEIDLSQLETVAYEYVVYHEERMEQQWNVKYSSMAEDLEAIAAMATDGEVELARSISAEYAALTALFSQLVKNHKKRDVLILKGAQQSKIDTTLSLEKRLTAQLLMKSQSTTANISKLGKTVHDQSLKAQQTANILTLILMGALASTVILLSHIFVRSLTRSMDKLTAGVKIIGKGNLDHRVVVETRDEIDDFASAFNQMTKNRKQADESLRASENKYKTLLETWAHYIIERRM